MTDPAGQTLQPTTSPLRAPSPISERFIRARQLFSQLSSHLSMSIDLGHCFTLVDIMEESDSNGAMQVLGEDHRALGLQSALAKLHGLALTLGEAQQWVSELDKVVRIIRARQLLSQLSGHLSMSIDLGQCFALVEIMEESDSNGAMQVGDEDHRALAFQSALAKIHGLALTLEEAQQWVNDLDEVVPYCIHEPSRKLR